MGGIPALGNGSNDFAETLQESFVLEKVCGSPLLPLPLASMCVLAIRDVRSPCGRVGFASTQRQTPQRKAEAALSPVRATQTVPPPREYRTTHCALRGRVPAWGSGRRAATRNRDRGARPARRPGRRNGRRKPAPGQLPPGNGSNGFPESFLVFAFFLGRVGKPVAAVAVGLFACAGEPSVRTNSN